MIQLIQRRKLVWVIAVAALAMAGWWWLQDDASVPPNPRTAPAVSLTDAQRANQRVAPEPVPPSTGDVATAPLAVPPVPVEVPAAPTPVTEFNGWLKRYMAAANPSARSALLAEGEVLAARRREFLFG